LAFFWVWFGRLIEIGNPENQEYPLKIAARIGVVENNWKSRIMARNGFLIQYGLKFYIPHRLPGFSFHRLGVVGTVA